MKIKTTEIIEAKKSFWDFIKTTPLEYSPRLSKKYGAKIYLKREDLQPVRSYKIRWAFNLINSLSEKEKKQWVVCASAWNHAQWVAISCKHLKIKGTIFMPITTPSQKVYKTKKFGWKFVEIILHWDTFDDALAWAKEYEKMHKSFFVHPFDDKKVITGQATIWLEIIEQTEEKPDYIICPIGWWWLICGLINLTQDISPKTRLIWIESVWAASMKNSIEIWKNTTLEKVDTFVDWTAVKRIWELGFKCAKDYWLDVFLSPENRVCSTILEYLKEEWIIVEPAWALSTDWLKDEKVQKMIKWKTVVLIISWSNFDFERLPEVKERSLKYEGLKKYIIVNFPQRPWALKEFLNFFWENDDITRFEYLKKSNKDKAPALVWIETKHKEDFKKFFNKLNKANIQYEDITNNELYFNLLV
jgi:threonine dehydratase